MDSERERLRLEEVARTFPALEEWRPVVAEGFEPEPGSQLADDDADWPPWPISSLATIALGVAFDHLDAVRHTITNGHFFPMAHESLIRSALIGASQAVWMLAPNDANKRCERARVVASYVYEEHRKYLNAVRLSDSALPDLESVAQFNAQRQAQLSERRTAAGEHQNFQTTTVIREAATEVMLPHLVPEVEVIWRGGSGAAHGLVYALLGHDYSEQSTPPDEYGRATFSVSGGAGRMANSYLCVFELARQGWGLRALRGSTPAKASA